MNRSNSFLTCAVLLAVLIGILGGAVTGGVAGYYAAQNAVPVAVPISAGASSVNPTALPIAPVTTNLTLKENSAVIDAVRKAKPAVVTVINELNAPARRAVVPTASGSGVIIDAKGYIVTNNHVVASEKKLTVIYADGSKAEADLVGADAVADIAVLRVNLPVPAIAPFGDSSVIEPGQTAIAIGSPLGDYRGTVTVGVVSGLNRTVGRQQGLIQTDAAINNGNSGGPLINALGQVIGINTLVVRSTSEGNVAEGLGFAIPSNQVKEIVNQILTKGKVERPYIGITYQAVDPQIASAMNLQTNQGIVVTQVESGSPGALAGLQERDVVLALNAQKINEEHPLATILFGFKVGDQVTLTILRDGKQIPIKVTLGPRPAGQ
ncbi:MAG: trypsin-like peptidase domain-containing protein [Chloroflexi bacterium]|nr:trypsin-like peptidase domain-containing protein [Chloroflexota bacterium]